MTPEKEPPSAIEIQLNRLERNDERVIIRLDESDRRFTDRMDRISEGVEAINHQIGTFSEGLARLEIQTERIATATERNAESIAQLIALAQQQQATVNQLLARN